MSGFALRGGSLSAGAEVVWDAVVLETAFTTSSEGRRGSLRFIRLRSLRRPLRHLLGAVLLPTRPRTGQLQVPENQCLGKEGGHPTFQLSTWDQTWHRCAFAFRSSECTEGAGTWPVLVVLRGRGAGHVRCLVFFPWFSSQAIFPGGIWLR